MTIFFMGAQCKTISGSHQMNKTKLGQKFKKKCRKDVELPETQNKIDDQI